MRKKDIALKLLLEVEKIYPNAFTELINWDTPFQFLVCIMLSAQTTDKQVNKVTANLFTKYPDAITLSKANIEEVMDTVKGINYFRTKAKHIVETSKKLVLEYDSQPPLDLIELQKLPGVGYKTANVFLNDLYKSNQGIAVDTHVARVAKAYGLTKEKDPDKISRDLERLYKKEFWYKVNSTFVLYGRYILKAKKPDMEKVVLKEYLVI
jgi:endonuclease III